jgi:hypothetical protein
MYALTNPDAQLQCVPNPDKVHDVCDICHFVQTPHEVTNDCTKAIMNDANPHEHCPSHEVKHVHPSRIQIDHNTWLFSGPNLGVVKLSCEDGTERTYQLPPIGVFKLTPGCSASITNGPSHINDPLGRLDITHNIKNQVIKLTDYAIEKTSVEQHFGDHGHKYFIGMGITITILFLILSGVVCNRISKNVRSRKGSRSRNNNSRTPDRAEEPIEMRAALYDIPVSAQQIIASTRPGTIYEPPSATTQFIPRRYGRIDVV